MKDPILNQVQRRIKIDRLSLQDAAGAIGIGVSALERHLAGDYVRSDSLAKYRLWLSGAGTDRLPHPQDDFVGTAAPIAYEEDKQEFSSSLNRQRNVVDLFCGCGGMSLGFERFDEGAAFRIAMALDIEEPMVRVFNSNHPSPSGEIPIARHEDITDFLSETEVQAFYLDHLARSTGNFSISKQLCEIGLASLKDTLRRLDAVFLEDFAVVRRSREYANAVKSLGSGVLGQTSVSGFHNATKLPPTGISYPKMGPLIWHHDGPSSDSDIKNLTADAAVLKRSHISMQKIWDAEADKLTSRAVGAGRGQLASAADRIRQFHEFLNGPIMRRVKAMWVNWRACREALRITFFQDEKVGVRIRRLYEQGNQVSVLLGGPPCQGFSRIGRGKIRSLREQSVHVHEDDDSVDTRNQLMHQYVLFVAALAPEVFLFENVRHFQAVVKLDGVEFDAAFILAEAIEAVSARGLHYDISSRIVVASEHAVPQKRERFVMAGVRQDIVDSSPSPDVASLILDLKKQKAVPLRVALEELPTPSMGVQNALPVFRAPGNPEYARATVSAEDMYRRWTFRGAQIDGHVARPPRPDDASFFALMGPGKRWMDYRCDQSPTVEKIREVLVALRKAMTSTPGLTEKIGASSKEIASLASMVDGSLGLRLLLESIDPHPGELQHHLLAENYLKKRDGAHGDWLSRMDPEQPSKTIVSHMAKDTYAFVHPFFARTLSVREAARVQSFPDDYRFSAVGLVDGFKVVGNAVPPLLSLQFAQRVAYALARVDASSAPNGVVQAKEASSSSAAANCV